MRTARCSSAASLGERTLALILAGGNGSRLGGLTRREAKPALPFGGQYRTIDFPLSNCVNSGVRRVALLTQYKAQSLIQHVQHGWGFVRPELGEFVDVWPAQQRCGKGWYAGTADAVYQNLEMIEQLEPDFVLVLAGGHICRMDYGAMLETHVASGLGATVGCVEVPIATASEFDIVDLDARECVASFVEKPARPRPLAGDPQSALASMGIYAFDRELLVDCLIVDARDPSSRHDFGADVLPLLVNANGVAAHVFRDPRTGRPAYWRDVGTLDSYHAANLELLDERPPLDLYDEARPLWTHQAHRPPPRFVGAGYALRSIVSAGCTVAGRVERSVLSPNCRVEVDAFVQDSVLLPGATIGVGCRVRNAIVDAGCVLPAGTVIGEDSAADGERFQTSPRGVMLVTAAALERADRGARFGMRVA